MMKRIALATLAGLMLTGCGASPTAPTFSSVARVPGKVANAQTIKVPVAFAGSGAIAMAFQFPTASAYHVAAVGSQVEKLVVTLKTRSFLLTKTVATAEVTRAQMKNGQAAVRFDALKAGDYTVSIQAFDASGSLLGSSEGASTVTEGKVSPVAIDLRLNGTSTPTPSTTGGLALTVTISEGGTVPTPVPTAKPLPTPAPTTAPVSGAFNSNADVLRTAAFKGCLFGSSTQAGKETADQLAAKLGRQLDVNHSFYRFDDAVPSAEDKADVAAGRVPLISLNPIRNGRGLKWADIAAGKEDAKLREVAKGLKALGKPVFFCFNHEPENDMDRGTTADYRAAWRHVSDVLASEKATNVVKVLIIMGGRTDDAYYPGDDVVDWVGGDTYNWAFSANNPKAKWRSFEEAMTALYNWGKSHHKPILLGETGCVEDPANASRKAEWLAAMGEAAKKMPELKALCYFNNVHDDGTGNNGWYIDTPQAFQAFKNVANDPYFAKH